MTIVSSFKERFFNLVDRRPNIFFIHVPKTGGTSIGKAIAKHYWDSRYYIDPIRTGRLAPILYTPQTYPEITDAVSLFRDTLAIEAMERQVKFIHGHARFNTEIWQEYGNRYAYGTVLRDPVKRYISHYFFNAVKAPGEHYSIAATLSDFLESERGRRIGQLYVDFFVGFPKGRGAPETLAEKTEVAKENLSKLALVGILEDLTTFTTRFKEKFGLDLSIGKENKNPVSRPEIEPHHLEKIQAICRYDLELYEYAQANLNGQREKMQAAKR